MLGTLTPVTNRKGKENLQEAATCFLRREMGDGVREENAGRHPSGLLLTVFVGVPLLGHYCYQRENKISVIIKGLQPF